MKSSAIIPALNEELTIASVVDALKLAPSVGQVIVVSDGSTDHTAQVARDAGAEVIELVQNLGKGGAMREGVKLARHDTLVFVDGDLIGLTPVHVQQLVEPVLAGQADMSVGIFKRGRRATDLAQRFAPFLSGQRAIRRELFEAVDGLELSRFGAELALTRYVREHHLRVQEVLLADLSHRMKEEKLGIIKGISARVKMYWEIAKYVSGS